MAPSINRRFQGNAKEPQRFAKDGKVTQSDHKQMQNSFKEMQNDCKEMINGHIEIQTPANRYKMVLKIHKTTTSR